MDAWIQGAHEDARALEERLDEEGPLELALVTCSYDTAFEPVAAQVEGKVEELLSVFPLMGPLRFSLLVVNDAQPRRREAFARGVEEGFRRCPRALQDEGRLLLRPLLTGTPGRFGLKGLALREGMLRALSRSPDVVGYVNLNRKVHAAQVATGLRALLDDGLDAAIGSRAAIDGGAQEGAGALGRLKSRVYNRLARSALPPLMGFLDTNAPMKLFRREAAKAVATCARLDGVSFDCEWLMILHEHGFRMGRFPVRWVQRRGSRPPWPVVASMVGDLARLRRAWHAGCLHREEVHATSHPPAR